MARRDASPPSRHTRSTDASTHRSSAPIVSRVHALGPGAPRRAAAAAAAARSKHRRVVHEGHQPFHPRRRFVAPRPAKPRVPAKRRVDVGGALAQRRVRRGERVHANLAVPELGGERASERVDGVASGARMTRVGSRRRERRGEPRPEPGAARDEQLGAFVVGRATTGCPGFARRSWVRRPRRPRALRTPSTRRRPRRRRPSTPSSPTAIRSPVEPSDE